MLVHEIIVLIIVKMKIKTKNRSHRYDINRPRSKHEHKSHYDDAYMYQAETNFMIKVSSTEAELKKSVAYKKKRV